MAITIRSVTVATATSATISVTTPSGGSAAQVGDLVVVFHGNDFYTAATMGTPTATGSPTITAVPGGSADGGTNLAHIKAYTYEVNTGGAQTIQVTETGSANEDKVLVAYVLDGADTTTPVDAAAGATGASSTSQPAPSVSPTSNDALVLIHNNSGGGGSTASYTSPGDVTEQYEHHAGGMSGVGATKQLVASGATGTFTFTAATSVPWAAVTVAINTDSGVSGVGVARVGVTASGSSTKVADGVGVGLAGLHGVSASAKQTTGDGALLAGGRGASISHKQIASTGRLYIGARGRAGTPDAILLPELGGSVAVMGLAGQVVVMGLSGTAEVI